MIHRITPPPPPQTKHAPNVPPVSYPTHTKPPNRQQNSPDQTPPPPTDITLSSTDRLPCLSNATVTEVSAGGRYNVTGFESVTQLPLPNRLHASLHRLPCLSNATMTGESSAGGFSIAMAIEWRGGSRLERGRGKTTGPLPSNSPVSVTQLWRCCRLGGGYTVTGLESVGDGGDNHKNAPPPPPPKTTHCYLDAPPPPKKNDPLLPSRSPNRSLVQLRSSPNQTDITIPTSDSPVSVTLLWQGSPLVGSVSWWLYNDGEVSVGEGGAITPPPPRQQLPGLSDATVTEGSVGEQDTVTGFESVRDGVTTNWPPIVTPQPPPHQTAHCPISN